MNILCHCCFVMNVLRQHNSKNSRKVGVYKVIFNKYINYSSMIITVMPHKCHGMSNHWHFGSLFNRLSRTITKKHGPSQGESTSELWTNLTSKASNTKDVPCHDVNHDLFVTFSNLSHYHLARGWISNTSTIIPAKWTRCTHTFPFCLVTVSALGLHNKTDSQCGQK